MQDYTKDFIHFMVKNGVLKFGSFTLKSGRHSPFFMNSGLYVTGSSLQQLGRYYAMAIYEHYGADFDVLFGPAYKGIPLCVATSIAFKELYDKDIRYCSNRKEIKDHGDTGILLGSPLKDGDKVVITEDVTTSGKSIQEVMPILKAQAKVQVIGLMVSLDRGEKGAGDISALKQIKKDFNIQTACIVTMQDVIKELYNKQIEGQVIINDKIKKELDAYYAVYGA